LNKVLEQKIPLIITNANEPKKYSSDFYFGITISTCNYSPILQLELLAYPETVEDLRLIRFWLKELSRAHFTFADAEDDFLLNPEFVDVLFPNESIYLSLGSFSIYPRMQESMMRSVAALTRTNVLRIDEILDFDIMTVCTELLMASKHGIGMAVFGRNVSSWGNSDSSDLIKVFKVYHNINFSKISHRFILTYYSYNYLPVFSFSPSWIMPNSNDYRPKSCSSIFRFIRC
jgi:hypothetical protein